MPAKYNISSSPDSFRRRVQHFTRQSFAFSDSEASLWHSVLFAINICVPALIGAARGDLHLSVVGAMVGLLLSFSDCAGSLWLRWQKLGLAVGLLLGLGTVGVLMGGYTPLFWLTFLVLTFATAWLSKSGHIVTGPLRFGSIALVTTAGLPQIGASTVGMVLMAAAISAATRTFGYWLFPNAAAVSLAGPNIQAEREMAGLRYCLFYSLTVALALLIANVSHVVHPVWVATTVLLVMQPDARSSLQRIVQRTIGTFLGVTVAALIVALVHTPWSLLAAVALIAFIVPQGSTRNYWLHSALVACLVLVLYDFAAYGGQFDGRLLGERIRDVSLGSALALGGTLLAFPRNKRHQVQGSTTFNS